MGGLEQRQEERRLGPLGELSVAGGPLSRIPDKAEGLPGTAGELRTRGAGCGMTIYGCGWGGPAKLILWMSSGNWRSRWLQLVVQERPSHRRLARTFGTLADSNNYPPIA